MRLKKCSVASRPGLCWNGDDEDEHTTISRAFAVAYDRYGDQHNIALIELAINYALPLFKEKDLSAELFLHPDGDRMMAAGKLPNREPSQDPDPTPVGDERIALVWLFTTDMKNHRTRMVKFVSYSYHGYCRQEAMGIKTLSLLQPILQALAFKALGDATDLRGPSEAQAWALVLVQPDLGTATMIAAGGVIGLHVRQRIINGGASWRLKKSAP